MLRRSRRAWLLGAALLLAVPQWPAPAAADHDRPGGAGQPAVEAVAGAVTLYEHYNPWICTDPEVPEGAPIDPICRWGSAVAVFSQGDVYLTSCMREIPPGVVIENVAINKEIGEQVNGYCGHSASMSGNDQWAFGGNNHPGHVNVVRGTEERWRCTLAGWDPTVQYHPDGHPVSGQGDWCGVWVPTTPTVNISGATAVMGSTRRG